MGDSTRTCQATGVWSGSAPTCQGVLLKSNLILILYAFLYSELTWKPMERYAFSIICRSRKGGGGMGRPGDIYHMIWTPGDVGWT